MTQRTNPITLILLALVAAGVAWMLESWLVTSSQPMFVPPITMPITLALVAVVLLVLAWPVRTYTRGLRRRREQLRDARARHPLDDPDAPGRDGADSDGGRRGDGDSDDRAGSNGRGRADSRDSTDPDHDLHRPKRVDPVHAVRVLAFAKASAMAGAVIAGAMVAVIAFVLTRPVISDTLFPLALAGFGGAVVLLVAGLVAESWCVLPPDEPDAHRLAAPAHPLLGA